MFRVRHDPQQGRTQRFWSCEARELSPEMHLKYCTTSETEESSQYLMAAFQAHTSCKEGMRCDNGAKSRHAHATLLNRTSSFCISPLSLFEVGTAAVDRTDGGPVRRASASRHDATHCTVTHHARFSISHSLNGEREQRSPLRLCPATFYEVTMARSAARSFSVQSEGAYPLHGCEVGTE